MYILEARQTRSSLAPSLETSFLCVIRYPLRDASFLLLFVPSRHPSSPVSSGALPFFLRSATCLRSYTRERREAVEYYNKSFIYYNAGHWNNLVNKLRNLPFVESRLGNTSIYTRTIISRFPRTLCKFPMHLTPLGSYVQASREKKRTLAFFCENTFY